MKYVGVDALSGKLTNNITNGLINSLDFELKILKYATEGAITLISVDSIINNKKD